VQEGDSDTDTETKVGYITVNDADPVADFTASPTSGTEPLTVAFTDTTTSYDGITAWSWDLDGDGSEDATVQHPTFEYTASGVYTVTLTVWEADGDFDFETKIDYITVDEPTYWIFLPIVLRNH
jgi:PKD repeat protein